MSTAHLEVEAKFHLTLLGPLREDLIRRGAILQRARLLERNWRLDDQEGRLKDQGLVLRLRQDTAAHLTYKRALATLQERMEIELEVSDVEAALALFAELGYRVATRYEKYRETFRLDDALVMLDELPFGCFAEVEGPSLERVRAAAEALGFDWSQRVDRTYLGIFELLRARRNLAFKDLTFENFAQVPPVEPGELGL
jgi:adenylate cyclase class IV